MAVVVMTTSCGIIAAPFRVAGALTRHSVLAGKKLHQNAKKASERRKEERAERKAAKEQAESGAPEDEFMDGGVLPPLPTEGGGEPDLMLDPLPPPEEATYPALPQ